MKTIKIGVPAGLNPEVALALKAELIAAGARRGEAVEVIESRLTLRSDAPDERIALGDKKITAFNALRELQSAGCEAGVIPGVRLQPYLAELQAELQMPIVPLFDGIGDAVAAAGAQKAALFGSLVAPEFIASKLPEGVELVEAGDALKALFARFEDEENGLVNGMHGEMADVMKQIVDGFAALGVQILIPANAQAARFAKEISALGLPVADLFESAAEGILENRPARLAKPFKVGMIGGLGPAATVDLYDKIVKATPAGFDQEHFKLVVEQNPQIPDRTKALLEDGLDPTTAMYSCAKRLQDDECDCIIIPCNTAHAFVPYMERHLDVPFINMQQAAMDEIYAKFGENARIGLMATTGTVRTGIYEEKAKAMGMPIFTPDEEHQARVMAAIYGPKGAKAGYTDGICREDLVSAAEYLVEKHQCNCLILGCTELPLILDETDDFECAGAKVSLIDPTSALARKVVRMAEESFKEKGVR